MDDKYGKADFEFVMDASFFRGLWILEEGEVGFGEAVGSVGIFGTGL